MLISTDSIAALEEEIAGGNNATLSTIFHMFHFLIIFDRHRASDLQHNGPVAQVVVNQAEKAPNANPVGIMSGSHVTEGS